MRQLFSLIGSLEERPVLDLIRGEPDWRAAGGGGAIEPWRVLVIRAAAERILDEPVPSLSQWDR